ncbi:MAG: hypothetical protein WD602_03420 [Actinomycetota bacterium]
MREVAAVGLGEARGQDPGYVGEAELFELALDLRVHQGPLGWG